MIETAYCSLHERVDCDLCDECNHTTTSHISAHDLARPLRAFAFEHSTCWAQSVCRECDAKSYGTIVSSLDAHGFDDAV